MVIKVSKILLAFEKSRKNLEDAKECYKKYDSIDMNQDINSIKQTIDNIQKSSECDPSGKEDDAVKYLDYLSMAIDPNSWDDFMGTFIKKEINDELDNLFKVSTASCEVESSDLITNVISLADNLNLKDSLKNVFEKEPKELQILDISSFKKVILGVEKKYLKIKYTSPYNNCELYLINIDNHEKYKLKDISDCSSKTEEEIAEDEINNAKNTICSRVTCRNSDTYFLALVANGETVSVEIQ